MSDRRSDLDAFYGLIAELERRCGGGRTLANCNGRMGWPQRGVYLFFEPGEVRDDGTTPRVVRVGTHALVPSKSTLWGRLAQHRGKVGGSHPGGGNHRGSVFRLHVGTALIAAGDWPDSISSKWAVRKESDRATIENEHPLEQAVSNQIGAMPFLWLNVDDDPGPTSARGLIERNAIALLSNHNKHAIDAPSAHWLGRHADRPTIRDSGLWNVNHVTEDYDPAFLDVFELYMQRTGKKAR